MQPDDKYFTDLDMQLQQLAMKDWATFVQIVGQENILKAKILVLRERKLSMTQIATKLRLTESQVRYRCEKRADKQPERKLNGSSIAKVA